MKKLTCRDIGLDCESIIEGDTQEEIEKNIAHHVWEVHAIKPEEATSEMKIKIKESIRNS